MPKLFDIQYNSRPSKFTKYSVMTFPNWKAMTDFAEYVKNIKDVQVANRANAAFKIRINKILSNPRMKDKNGHILQKYYGLFGKQPLNYDDAMQRSTFLYYDEYKRIKQSVQNTISKELLKSSTAEVMKPKFVYNDKQLGEFVFEKAAMSIEPQIFYYSPTHKREVDYLNEKVLQQGNVMILESDRTIVVYAFRIEIGKDKDGKEIYEFYEVKGEESLLEAQEKYPDGIIDVTSENKKVYLYKEKKPKTFNAIKIIVGFTGGGFTHQVIDETGRQVDWINDFYTGITAAVIVDVLEGLGYSVQVELVMGGGRCGSCYRKLNFGGQFNEGRRYFSFTVKSFDDPLDMDGMLYTLCDPSFHNIKFVSLLNYFFTFFGDQIDTNDLGFNGNVTGGMAVSDNEYGNPNSTWHGIEPSDMLNPIGMYFKYMDDKKGEKNILQYYIHQVPSETAIITQIMDIVTTSENYNLEAAKKFQSYDFGNTK